MLCPFSNSLKVSTGAIVVTVIRTINVPLVSRMGYEGKSLKNLLGGKWWLGGDGGYSVNLNVSAQQLQISKLKVAETVKMV